MRTMKDSGIPWIGKIPETWSKEKVIRIFQTIGSGTTPKSDDETYFEGNIKWIQSGDINGGLLTHSKSSVSSEALQRFSALKVYSAPYIVIAMYGASIGNMSVSMIDGCVNQACCVLGDTKQNLQYFFYVLKCSKDYLSWKSVGGGQPNISQETIKQLWLPLPSIEEQAEIVKTLDTECARIDAVMEQTRASIEEYKKLKQSVITQAVTKGIRPNRPMKDSGIDWIGQIPAEWQRIKLKYCTYVRARLGWKGLKADEYVQEGYPLLSAFNIINNKLSFESINYISKERYDESPEIKLREDDILLVKDGAGIGKCAIVEELPQESTTNGSLAVITVTTLLHPRFLYYYFLSTLFQKYIDRLKDGMGVPHLFQADLRDIEIVYTGMDEQKEIVTYLDRIVCVLDSAISRKEHFIAEMESYKKSLIFEYVTGKKEVPNADYSS